MTTPRSLLAVGLLTAGLVVGSTVGSVAATVITSAQIKDGTITSIDVKDGGLGAKDLSPGTVKALQSLAGYQLRSEQRTVSANTPTDLAAHCPTGKRVIGGTAYWATSSDAVQFAIDFDGRGGTAYTGGVPDEDVLRVQVVCATVTS